MLHPLDSKGLGLSSPSLHAMAFQSVPRWRGLLITCDSSLSPTGFIIKITYPLRAWKVLGLGMGVGSAHNIPPTPHPRAGNRGGGARQESPWERNKCCSGRSRCSRLLLLGWVLPTLRSTLLGLHTCLWRSQLLSFPSPLQGKAFSAST